MRSIVLPDDFIVPASALASAGLPVVPALTPTITMEQSMKLTDTQLVLLSRASQRPDQCAEIPANLKGVLAQKFVAKLLDGGLVEEVQAETDMPAWRKDNDGAFALHLTEAGLSAISADGPDRPAGNGAGESAGVDAAASSGQAQLGAATA